MISRTASLFGLSLLLACLSASAQTVKKVPLQRTSPASGAEMYKAYCASCHGMDGKGNGPAAPAMKKPPSDLTALAQQNGGKFPQLTVFAVIKGDSAAPEHGSADMPVWGPIFRHTSSQENEGEEDMRISNLTHYIQSMQTK